MIYLSQGVWNQAIQKMPAEPLKRVNINSAKVKCKWDGPKSSLAVAALLRSQMKITKQITKTSETIPIKGHKAAYLSRIRTKKADSLQLLGFPGNTK